MTNKQPAISSRPLPAYYWLVAAGSCLLLGLLGCYCETNDDLAMTQLLRGASAAAPVTDLSLYFHGLARPLAALYAAFPAGPWYGVLLHGLLGGATVAAFVVLTRLLRGAGWVAAGLAGFFLVGWLEHGLWFSYVRVAILLSGAGVLLAAQRPNRRWAVGVGLLMVLIAWQIRPSAAGLGLLAAAPGALWLGGSAGGRLLLLAAGLVLVGNLALTVTRSPAAATYRALDVLKSNRNDYQLYRPAPRTAPDRLGLQAVDHWLLGDSALVNEGLFQRATRLEPGYFLRHQAPAKLRALLSLVGRDYFPLLLGQLAICWLVLRNPRYYPRRRWFWLVQLGYVLLVLGLGVVLKLPPRLGLPLFDLWLISNLAYVGRQPLPPWRFAKKWLVLVALVVLAYGAKTRHRVQVLSRERTAHLAYLARLRPLVADRLVVTAGLETAYKSLSPFESPRAYTISRRPVLSLTGWPTLDPSQARLRQRLTGTRDLPLALRRLAGRPDVVWLLTPDVARFMGAYLLARDRGATWLFRPGTALSPDSLLPRFYVVDVKSVK